MLNQNISSYYFRGGDFYDNNPYAPSRPDETCGFLYICGKPAGGACSCQIIPKMLMAGLFSGPSVKGPFSLGQCIGDAAR